MKKMRIMLVFGTRPEAVKMAPLCHALKAESARFETLVCVTGQHRQMLDSMLGLFGIEPDVDLDLMRSGQDLFHVTASVLTHMGAVLEEYGPDALLAQGDTTTTLASAMAGFYRGVPVGHVEAGLRTHDMRSPFPEEFNRQVVSRVARWHFAPTQLARENLLREQVADSAITVTGNTVIDALFRVLSGIESDPARRARLEEALDGQLPFPWREERFVLITGHRRENFGAGFSRICHAIAELARRYPAVHFVYPVHLNPNVREPVNAILAGEINVHLTEPLDYEPFLYLLKYSYLVLTDSGGVQEEAPSLGKPVLVMREVTERPEGIEAGTARLVGAHRERIMAGVAELLENEASYRAMARAHNPYGDGKACERIVAVLRTL